MKWPPLSLLVKVASQRRSIGFWLPLFILGPIVLVLLLVFLVILIIFAALATIFTMQLKWWRPIVFGIPAVVRLLWNLRGLNLDVEKQGGRVQIKIQ